MDDPELPVVVTKITAKPHPDEPGVWVIDIVYGKAEPE